MYYVELYHILNIKYYDGCSCDIILEALVGGFPIYKRLFFYVFT